MKKSGGRIKNRGVGVMTFPNDVDIVGPSPLEAFPEHARLIAYIIAEWSQIEYKLAMWLALRLSANNDIILPMVYALETSRARLDVMATALRQLLGQHPSVKGRLDKMLIEAGQVLTLRNRYAHAHFGPDADSRELAIAGMGKKPPTNVPLHELTHHLNRAKSLSHQLGLILAAELGVPIKGPGAPDSVPAHPLGSHAVRTDRVRIEPPGPFPEKPPEA